VTVKGKQLAGCVRKVYNYFKTGMVAIITAAVLASGAMRRYIRCTTLKETARRIALMTGVFSASATTDCGSLGETSGDEEQQSLCPHW